MTSAVSIKKQIVEILNRVSESTADKCVLDLVSLDYTKMDQYVFLCDKIFDKAIEEQESVEIYGRVCAGLNARLHLPSADERRTSFKSLFLKKCQNAFENGLCQIGCDGLNEEERIIYEEMQAKKKKRYLGLLQFMAELYKVNLIPAKIITAGCVRSFCMKISQDKDYTYIEFIHKLLINLNSTIYACDGHFFDVLVERLKKIKESGEICKRDESMIDELLELHEKWVAEAPH